MKRSYLEITFRHGRPLAAYLYLPRRPGDFSARTVKCDGGMIVDYAADGRPIGIEITSPRSASLETINQILSSVDEPAQASDLAPLGFTA